MITSLCPAACGTSTSSATSAAAHCRADSATHAAEAALQSLAGAASTTAATSPTRASGLCPEIFCGSRARASPGATFRIRCYGGIRPTPAHAALQTSGSLST